MKPPVKILLADDHLMFLESMTMLLKSMNGVDLVTTATNGREVLRFLELYAIDVIICDFQMPLVNGLDVVVSVKRDFPACPVLILSMSDDLAHIKDAIQAGAAGYLLKTADKNELHNAIMILAEGGTYFSGNVVQVLSKSSDASTDHISLSDRELEILKLVVREFSSTEIAEKLFISLNTVETHRKHIYRKLGVTSSLGLLKYALRHGLAD